MWLHEMTTTKMNSCVRKIMVYIEKTNENNILNFIWEGKIEK